MSTIIFSGKKYESVEEMPANERAAFEQLSDMFVDKNGNGIPDFLEGDMVKNVLVAFTSNMNYNGQIYGNMSELPPEVREKVNGAFQKLIQMGIVPQGSPMGSQVQFTIGKEPVPSSEPMISRPYSPTIQEDSGSSLKWIMIGLGMALCLVLTAAGVFIMLSR